MSYNFRDDHIYIDKLDFGHKMCINFFERIILFSQVFKVIIIKIKVIIIKITFEIIDILIKE